MLRLAGQDGRSALDLPPRADGVTGEEDEDEEEAVLPAVLLAEREPNRENWGVNRGKDSVPSEEVCQPNTCAVIRDCLHYFS